MLKKIIKQYEMKCIGYKIEEKLDEIGLIIYSCESGGLFHLGTNLYIIPNPSKENTMHVDYVMIAPPFVSLSTLGKISPNLEKLLLDLENAGEIKQLR